MKRAILVITSAVVAAAMVIAFAGCEKQVEDPEDTTISQEA